MLRLSTTTHRSLSPRLVRVFSAPAIEPSTVEQVRFKQIPAVPFIGSMFKPHSGIDRLDFNDINGYFRRLHREHGPFYSVGIPGFGRGSLDGTLIVIRDPLEMLKVLKSEGQYPSGATSQDWLVGGWMRKNYDSAGFFGQGPEWKRLRTFLQKDLLSPVSAKEYLGVILSGAAKSAPGAAHAEDFNRYLNFCAMDMFSGVLFAGKTGMTEEDYTTFCRTAVDTLSQSFDIVTSPWQNLAHYMGIETSAVKEFYAMFDQLDALAEKRLKGFVEQIQSGQVSEAEKGSYFYKLMQRQPEADVSIKEAIELCVLLMIAAVDTTAAKTSWNMVQLAIHPEIQEELYHELKAAVGDGDLTPEVFEENRVPLLSAFIRETHRCTPVLFGDIFKQLAEPTTVHGRTLPKGSSVMFDSLTNMMDEELVEDPLRFDPKRWLKPQVEARKGTPQAIIDHPFYSGPFSQGARRCPGSRIAGLEVQAMISRLLLDYRIEGPSMPWTDVKSRLRTLVVPVWPERVRFVPRH